MSILEASASGSKSSKRKSVMFPPILMKKATIKVVHVFLFLEDLESFVVIKDEHVGKERKDEEDNTSSVDNILSLLKE